MAIGRAVENPEVRHIDDVAKSLCGSRGMELKYGKPMLDICGLQLRKLSTPKIP